MKGGSADDFRDSFFQECEELLEAMHDGFEKRHQVGEFVHCVQLLKPVVQRIQVLHVVVCFLPCAEHLFAQFCEGRAIR